MRPTILAYTNNPSCSTVFCRSFPCASNLLCPLPAPSSTSQPVQPTNPTSSVISVSYTHLTLPTTPAYTNNHSCTTVFCRSLPCASNLLCPLPAPFSPSQLVQPTNPNSSVICGPTICQDHFQSPRCDTYLSLIHI